MPPSESPPEGYHLVRRTRTFDVDTVPKGLLSTHRVADGVWGRLVVYTGLVRFVFDESDEVTEVEAGQTLLIPPALPHHVSPSDDATFAVEFYGPAPGSPSAVASE